MATSRISCDSEGRGSGRRRAASRRAAGRGCTACVYKRVLASCRVEDIRAVDTIAMKSASVSARPTIPLAWEDILRYVDCTLSRSRVDP